MAPTSDSLSVATYIGNFSPVISSKICCISIALSNPVTQANVSAPRVLLTILFDFRERHDSNDITVVCLLTRNMINPLCDDLSLTWDREESEYTTIAQWLGCPKFGKRSDARSDLDFRTILLIERRSDFEAEVTFDAMELVSYDISGCLCTDNQSNLPRTPLIVDFSSSVAGPVPRSTAISSSSSR